MSLLRAALRLLFGGAVLLLGGVAANFITADGGVTDQAHVLVTDITDYAASVDIQVYDEASLPTLGDDYSDHGFSVIILPGMTAIHSAFARNVQGYAGVLNSPLIGWIAGVHLSEVGVRTPKSFAGDGLTRDGEAVVMHVTLPQGLSAHLDIINLFKQGWRPSHRVRRRRVRGRGAAASTARPPTLLASSLTKASTPNCPSSPTSTAR
ncbi:MAG: hypothetical protein AB1542_17415 [Pseudomonadota bacterium]